MVWLGTRNARAISSVVRPQSVRRVRATCASVASAGWQQVKMRRSRIPGSRGNRGTYLPFRTRVDSESPAVRRFAAVFGKLRAKNRIPSQAVNCLVTCRADDPGPRFRRNSGLGPLQQRRRKGFLHHFLGKVEIAQHSDERGQNAVTLIGCIMRSTCSESDKGIMPLSLLRAAA